MAEAGSSAAALPGYRLGELLGKGAFGSVYRALSLSSGETVAIKQIGLGNIPRTELPEIMSEIDLLKNLDHANIVTYRGFIKTPTYLFIILELCENGSLLTICKKFGRFPESLVSIYIYQVLEGLQYLHDQGVIHRDIKASNILATTEGSVKLADFGVATRAGPIRDSAVVGSPYWMAPEIIAQSGATTASDIWSVGCVVIELLEGRPPYYALDPMLALFRIVNDDCPPLPESASPMARDFVVECFQKDCNLRISAKKLLKHPWMAMARSRLEQTKREQKHRLRPVANFDETIAKVQEWNQALDAPAGKGTIKSIKGRVTIKGRPSDQVAQVLQSKAPRAGLPQLMARFAEDDANNALASSTTTASPGRSRPKSTSSSSESDKENKEADVWDGDFEEGISARKIKRLDRDKSDAKPSSIGADDNTRTLKPKATRKRSSELLRAPKPKSIVAEDYSDVTVEDEDRFKRKVASIHASNSHPKAILHPRDVLRSKPKDDSTGSNDSARTNSSRSRTVRPSASQTTNLSISAKPYGSLSRVPESPEHPSRAVTSRPGPSESTSSLDKYFEPPDDDDYSDLIDKTAGVSLADPTSPTLQLTERLSNRSWLRDDASDEEDPFAQVEDDEGEGIHSSGADGDLTDSDLAANVARDKLARLGNTAQHVVDALSRGASEADMLDACLTLIDMFDESADVKSHFVRRHGLIALVESLRVKHARDALGALLRIVNLLIDDDAELLEKLCLIGGCPVVIAYASSFYSRDIRLEAALFIGAMCRTSLLTLQMFVGCGGLRVLAEMVGESYATSRDVVWLAVDGVSRVFEMPGMTSRNDFCRMLAQDGLLASLASALTQTSVDEDDLAESAKAKVIYIFLIFAQSDLRVKDAMSDRKVAGAIVKALDSLEGELLAVMLKAVKNVTMSPNALANLQRFGIIPALVRILSVQLASECSTDVLNPVVNALYNLCRLSKARQEEAAQAGAIPALIRLVSISSPLKQFALPILCDFAQTSSSCRTLLWQHDGLFFYLGLLRDPYWSLSALESIAAWHVESPSRIEDGLLQPASLEAIGNLFSQHKGAFFGNLLEPLHKLLRTSAPLSAVLARQPSFFERLVRRLDSHRKVVVRLNLLRIAKTVCEAMPPVERDFARRQPALVDIVNRLATNDPAVLVRELAKEVAKELAVPRRATAPRSSGAAAVLAAASERMKRRTRSDGHFPSSASTPMGLGVREDGLPPAPSSGSGTGLSRFVSRVRKTSADKVFGTAPSGVRLRRTSSTRSSRSPTPTSPPLLD